MQDKIRTLLKAGYHYYRLGESIITDEVYDKLFEEIKNWETSNNVQDKLTDKICLGYFEGDNTVKIKHTYPMLSIEKDNSRAIIKETVITPKLDGVALELEYVEGELYRKLTRGDGEYGSDVTKIKIHGIPETIRCIDYLVIRGEVLCPIYEEYGKVHRNVVAGALGKVDFAEDRGLRFIAYWTSLDLPLYTQELNWLKGEGFSVVPYLVSARPLNITPDLISHNFPTDGYVLRENNNTNRDEKTAHHYKNQWAYKFAAESKETVIKSIDWKKSKNGTFSPVAELAPVILDGATVSRVTLNNLDYIEQRDICIGDKVLVHKAKDIIPEIKEVLYRPKDREEIVLINCPTCGSELIMKGVRLTCTNIECSVDLLTEHFCKVIGIKGLGLKSIEKLNLSTPLDIYELTCDTLKKILGKNGEKVYTQIKDSIKADVVTILCAMNIPSVKKAKLRKIFNVYPDLKVLGDYSSLIEVEGIGEKTADIITEWFDDFIVLKAPLLEEIGFNLTVEKTTLPTLTIAVTGKLPMSRKEFTTFMATKNVEVKSLTKNSSLLICGEKPGASNLSKAEKYGIQIVPYQTFIKDLNF